MNVYAGAYLGWGWSRGFAMGFPVRAFVEMSRYTWLRVGVNGNRRGRRRIACSMNLFKSVSICAHIFITSVIIKSQHRR